MIEAIGLLIGCTIGLFIGVWALWALVLLPIQVMYRDGVGFIEATKRIWK